MLKDLDASEAVPSAPQEPDWLKGLGKSEAVTAASQTEEPDWLKGLGGNEAIALSSSNRGT